MITKLLKPCPFCGGKAEIQIRDSECSLRDEEYEKNPYNGLMYSIGHRINDNLNCPIANYEQDMVGVYLFESKDEAIETWNKRIELIKNKKDENMEYLKAYEFKDLKPNMWVYDIETDFIY